MKNLFYLFGFITLLISCEDQNASAQSNAEVENTIVDSDYEEITFPSLDSLTISARLYEINKDAPVIVLCHQARFNKFEYEGIAQELNNRGFNCLAIDQRSGGPIANEQNETTLHALKAGKSIDYLDAEQDITAAVDFASEKYGKKVLLWGSSYSSTLVLYVAAENENVMGVVSFSPGNYFAEERGDLIPILEDFQKPLFLTSSKQEAPFVKEMIPNKELGDNQMHFIPQNDGHHGSRALWLNQLNGEEYWEAIDEFLTLIKDE